MDALIQKFDLDKILDKNCKNNKFYEKKLENLCSLIIKQIPTLHIFLVDLKLNLDFFLTSWILTLFSDSMENQFLSIVWDYMLIFGWKFFNYFILNILTLFEKDILNSKQNNLTYLKKNTNIINTFLYCIFYQFAKIIFKFIIPQHIFFKIC